jgi:GGDEF domain-containing protein
MSTRLLTTPEMVLWSAALGAAALVVLLAAADAVYSRTRASFQTAAYMSGCFVFFALLSGLAQTALEAQEPGTAQWLEPLQILIGPACAGLGSWWISHWLSAHRRDRVMATSLRVLMILCLTGGPICLLLGAPWGLPLAGALTVTTASVAGLMSARAAQMGDRMAWVLALACGMTMLSQLGLYALAINARSMAMSMQIGVAFFAICGMVLVGLMLWLRNRHALAISEGDSSQRDPITRLLSSMALVQKIIRAQRRRRSTQRDGALMAVMVFDTEALAQQVGQFGLNDVYIQLARRLQSQTGVVNPAGRYYDRCFVVLIESMQSPRWIRTLGLRVACSLRRPMRLTSLSGDRIEMTIDIAVGVVHMSAAGDDVDLLLHEAQRVTQAARHMRSRAAFLSPENGLAVPVESAELATSWGEMRAAKKQRRRNRRAARRTEEVFSSMD